MKIENSPFPLKSNLQTTSQPTMSALSSLYLDKENIIPPASSPPSTSSMNDNLIKNRKRKRTDWSDLFEDITHLFYPNNNNEVMPCAAPLHLYSPTESRVEMVKQRVFKPAKMSNRVCLRKEFR